MILRKAQKTALRELFNEIKNSDLSVNIDDPDGVYLVGLTIAGWAVRFRSLAESFLPRESIARLKMIEANDIAGDLASTHEARMEIESLIPVVEDLLDEDSAADVITPTSVRKINNPELNRLTDKVVSRIKAKDYDGAITVCKTLTEALLKGILNEENVDFKGEKIQTLHNEVKKLLNLNPRPEHKHNPVNQVLNALIKILCGLDEMANTYGDRHPSGPNPRRHRAKLMVNATFSYCEFLVDVREYQRLRGSGR